jgi:hypothetical protein
MITANKDFEAFSNKYQTIIKEILLLTSDESGGGSKLPHSWEATEYFLAYVDLETNELKNGKGRINWLVSDEDFEQNGISFPYHFKQGTIYHLAVRELIDKTVPEGRLPSAYNNFMVVEILKEDVKNDELLNILTEYRTSVEIIDEKLGKFVLNKNYGSFQGELKWIEKNISVSLYVDQEEKNTWTNAIQVLRDLFNQQEQFDLAFRTYAGEQLTALANDCLEEGNDEITKSDFINRIRLSELSLTFDGNYSAYYDDDDMFYGHIVDVAGNIKTGISSASIAG